MTVIGLLLEIQADPLEVGDEGLGVLYRYILLSVAQISYFWSARVQVFKDQFEI